MKTTHFVLAAILSGLLMGSAYSETPPASSTAPTKKELSEVGISSQDGISMSGDDVIVTRNGVMEKLTKVLELPNGVRVDPNGTITAKGEKLLLRPTQILTFDGRFLDIPIKTSVSPKTSTTTTTTTQPATATTTQPVTAAERAAATERATAAQREAEKAAAEEERRRAALKAGVPPKAGEGAQR